MRLSCGICLAIQVSTGIRGVSREAWKARTCSSSMPKVKGIREEADVLLAVRVDMVPMRDDGGYALTIDMLGIQRECRQREWRKRSQDAYKD